MRRRPQPRPVATPAVQQPTAPQSGRTRHTPQGAPPGPTRPPQGWPLVALFLFGTGLGAYGWPSIVLRVAGAAMFTVYAAAYVRWRRTVGGGWLWH